MISSPYRTRLDRHGDAGASHVGMSSSCAADRTSALVHPSSASGERMPVSRPARRPGRCSPEIVRVGAVDDGVEASRARERVEAGPQLGLAEVAAVRAVPEIARILQLVRVELDQRHSEPGGQVHRGPPLRLGVGRAPPDRGEEAIRAQRLCPRHGEKSRVDPAGVAEQHLAETTQVATEAFEVFMEGKRNRILIPGERARPSATRRSEGWEIALCSARA